MMQNTRFKLSALAIATAMACSPAAFATNGYFVHGYGTKSSGMGGVGVALPQDSLAAATNPAGMSWAGSGADAGMMLFNPRRDGELDATMMGGAPASADSGATLFMVPNAGFAMDMAGMTMGMSIYANGGMNTRYGAADNLYANAFGPAIPGFASALSVPVPAFSNMGTLGVNLSQLIIAPSASMKLGENHSVGASMLVGYQRFRAYGLGLFQGLSNDPSHVTNKGDDDAWGAGIRLGWTGQITDTLTMGATAASKIYMQPFKEYSGLFAEQGDFDIPANYAVGLAFKPSSDLTLAFDVQRIMYGGVAAIANPGPTLGQFAGDLVYVLSGSGGLAAPLGSDGGYGFGWEDQTVYKLGVGYDYNDQWTFRAGFNYGKSPIPSSQNLFNIIAPGVVEKHLTLGSTYHVDRSTDISVAYMHAFRKDQTFSDSVDMGPPFGVISYDANIGMSQNALEVSYGIKF